LCQQPFEAYPLQLPAVGEKPNERVISFITGLGAHLATVHRADMETISGTLQDFTGLLIMSQFETADKPLAARIEQTRAEIHKRTTGPNFIKRAQLRELIERIGLSPEHFDTVVALMSETCDMYESIGNWDPQMQAETAALIV
jgi:hypothetical protein